MKVRSTKELPYSADRLGIKRAIIEIDLTIDRKDDIKKVYHLLAVDCVIDRNPTDVSYGGRVRIFSKTYEKTYEEYDTQRELLLSINTYEETGSELDDKLLQDALLYNLSQDPVYESEGTDWIAYTDPIEEPVIGNTLPENSEIPEE